MPVKTYQTIPDAQPEEIIFFCSDPRLQESFERFPAEERELKKGQYILMPKFGGPAAFVHRKHLRYEYRDFMLQVEFAFMHWSSSLKRFILIAHEQCGVYKDKLDAGGKTNPERDDLFPAAEHLQMAYPNMGVELYYGRFANAEQTGLCFEKVEQEVPQAV